MYDRVGSRSVTTVSTAEMAAAAGQALLSLHVQGMAQHPIMHFLSPTDIGGRGGASGALICMHF